MAEKEENKIEPEEFKSENKPPKHEDSEFSLLEIEINSIQSGPLIALYFNNLINILKIKILIGLKTKITELVCSYELGGSIEKVFEYKKFEKITFLVIYGQAKILSYCWAKLMNFLSSQKIKYELKTSEAIPAQDLHIYPIQFWKKKTKEIFLKKDSFNKSISSGANEAIYKADFSYKVNEVNDENFMTSLKNELKKITKKDVATGFFNIVSKTFFK